MNVVIAGSRRLPVRFARDIVERLVAELCHNDDEHVRILLRSPVGGPPAEFEALVAELAEGYGVPVQWCYPDRRGGREATYVRDAHMTAMADHVFAFFATETLMEGGTAHVVDKAIDKEIPVTAYEVDEDGLRWVGSL